MVSASDHSNAFSLLSLCSCALVDCNSYRKRETRALQLQYSDRLIELRTGGAFSYSIHVDT